MSLKLETNWPGDELTNSGMTEWFRIVSHRVMDGGRIFPSSLIRIFCSVFVHLRREEFQTKMMEISAALNYNELGQA